QPQKPKLEISHLTGNFYVFTTYNFYKGNPVPANGMYLVTDSGAVMFDSPWDTTQFQPLLDSIKTKHNKPVVICIATHSHKDKTAGLEFLKDRRVKTFTTRQTDEISKVKGEKRAEFLMEQDTIFSVGQYKFQIYYPGQGHTADNIVIWFDKDKVLYGGCLVKSVEAKDLGNLEDANVKEWPATIKKIQAKFKTPKFIIPGHQSWTSKESLNHTLKLIQEYK
ncbi:MAG TPA: BlaB/IND/MUS family subclass B1 metallo-beta-lactamase, partial [Chitinophagaceae bacterium]|nr:BlaB/IND/MUS family subclass B1 metallo-beta-lactamase [Chitinophagaceae bacterium]